MQYVLSGRDDSDHRGEATFSDGRWVDGDVMIIIEYPVIADAKEETLLIAIKP